MKDKLKPFLGPILFISSALLVFFFAAFTIVLFRTKSTSYINMPNLVGRKYVEVHNELSRLRLKVKLEEENFTNKMDGIVLQQSVPAGKKIEVGSKLSLIVNISEHRLTVPKLTGIHLDNARSKLQKVLAGDSYIELEIGGITYIPVKDGMKPDTVIQQIPEAGKVTNSKEKIYLLVTEPDTKKKSVSIEPSEQWIGMYFPIVMESLNLQNKKWKIESIVQTQRKTENGLIESYKEVGGTYLFQVKYFPSKRKIESGLELIEYPIEATSEYSVNLETISAPKRDMNQVENVEDGLKEPVSEEPTPKVTILNSTGFSNGDKLTLLFYRIGDVELSILDSANEVKKKYTIKSEIRF